MTIEIINGKTDGFIGEDKIYIGRKNSRYGVEASPLANVFSIKSEKQRDSSIENYTGYLFQQYASGQGPVYEELMRLATLHKQGVYIKLACWCAPKACHGDVIKKIVYWIAENVL